MSVEANRLRVVPPAFIDFVAREHLFSDVSVLTTTALTGGVSSEIWLITDGSRIIVVKQPLAELAVASEWKAPIERSRYEVEWLRTVQRLVPGITPEVLAADLDNNLLAMAYLEPADHPVWKAKLMNGDVDPGFAAQVGERLGLIHEATAKEPALAADFDTEPFFIALRMDPYLATLALRHPDLKPTIDALIQRTLSTRRALVHGDVSPKNILAGPTGPVFIDAETAWWGDPAFDLAFCLNHLFLKHLVLTDAVGRARLGESVEQLLDSYASHISWESPEDLFQRAATLLPALMLARVDGKSPAEYLGPEEHEAVRAFTIPLLRTLAEVTPFLSKSTITPETNLRASDLNVVRVDNPRELLKLWQEFLL